MPTYEYRCEKGHEFELFQRMSEPPVEKCVQCGAKAERLLSGGTALLFKGSGFYITDYRSDTYKKAAEADKGASSGATTSESKSAESKSAEPKSTDSGKAGPSTTSSSSGSE